MEKTHDSHFLAYVAGLFDGEGSVCIGRNNTRHGARRYVLRVNCVNSCPWPLMELHEAFGGSFITKKAGKWRRPGQKQMYIWDCSSRQALGFLKAVLPYLRIKKEQVRLAIAYQERIPQKPGVRGVHTAPEEMAIREDYAVRMSKLNKSEYLLQ